MENLKEENLSIIDADSIIYVVGSKLQNMLLEPLGISKVDEFIESILIANQSKHYIGFFGGAKAKNFRYDVAVSKPYKGNRPKKEDWFKFWAPILKRRMEEYWGFKPCYKIEADDACSIAANKYRGVYNKVFVCTPDKDLFQIKDVWFFDYTKRITAFCPEEVSINKFVGQMITGDRTDNIDGCVGAGPKAAEPLLLEVSKKQMNFKDALEATKKFYVEWHTKVLLNKISKAQEKEFLKKYKEENGVKRLTKAIKSEALSKFFVDTSEIKSLEEIDSLFKEQYLLLKLLDTEEEGLKYNFKLQDVKVETGIDWDSVILYNEELEDVPEIEGFEFEDDL